MNEFFIQKKKREMNTYRYSIWKENPTSRPALIISDDGGNKYTKVAVFRNEECVEMFENWLEDVLRECSDMLFKNIAGDLARMIGGAEHGEVNDR